MESKIKKIEYLGKYFIIGEERLISFILRSINALSLQSLTTLSSIFLLILTLVSKRHRMIHHIMSMFTVEGGFWMNCIFINKAKW